MEPAPSVLIVCPNLDVVGELRSYGFTCVPFIYGKDVIKDQTPLIYIAHDACSYYDEWGGITVKSKEECDDDIRDRGFDQVFDVHDPHNLQNAMRYFLLLIEQAIVRNAARIILSSDLSENVARMVAEMLIQE